MGKKQENPKRRTELNNYLVSVFYKFDELEDLVFYENIPICCGSRANAKKYAEKDFFDRWADNVSGENLWKEPEQKRMPRYEIPVYEDFKEPSIWKEKTRSKPIITEIRIYDEPNTQAKEHILDLYKEFDIKVQKKREEEERQKEEEKAKVKEWSEFLKVIPGVYSSIFRKRRIRNLECLEKYSVFSLFSDISRNVDIESYIELMNEITKKNIKLTQNENDRWIQKKLKCYRQRKSSGSVANNISTTEFFSSFENHEIPYVLKKMYNDGLLPDYLSDFKNYKKNEFTDRKGIGSATVYWLIAELAKRGFSLMDS